MLTTTATLTQKTFPSMAKDQLKEQVKIVWNESQEIILSGDLTFSSVPNCDENMKKIFAQWPLHLIPIIDLLHISHCDSAGLALLLQWQRSFVRGGRKILFRNVPTQLRSLAEHGGVADLLF